MRQEKLENLFDYLPKSKIKAGEGLEEGKYPFYTSSGIQSKYLDDFQHGPGCLVFGTGGKASVHLTTNRFSTSTDCIAIKPKPIAGIDASYVFQYFKGNMKVLENGFKGAGLKHISKAYLSEIKIPHPEDINDQIRIAHLLGKVEGLITQRKQHLQQLDDLLKSVFLEMFGDPVRNEKGWNKPPFSDLLSDIESGKSPKCEARPASGDEWGVLKLGAVTHCVFDGNENKALPAETAPVVKHEVKIGDLLFSRKNTYELVAACAYVFETRPRLLMPDLIFRFVFKENAEVNPIYIWKLLTNDSQRKAIQSFAAGAAGSMPNISKANLKTAQLPVPPIELQNQFAAIVEKVEALKSRYQQSLNDLESLYGAISQKAFKGELDLSQMPFPEADITAELSEAPEQLEVTIDVPLSINLPNTDYLLDALTDSSLRKRLLADWLESYCQQIGNAPFSANDFLTAAQTRISELHPDAEFELAVEDFDHIKNWVFEALNSGRLQQEQNVTGQDADGKLLLGNLVELKARTQP